MSFIDDLESLGSGALNDVANFGSSVGKIATLPINAAKEAIGSATNNPTATANAQQAVSQGVSSAGSLVHGMPDLVAQLGLSFGQALRPGATNTPGNATAGAFTPSGGVEQAIFGSQPIQSFANQYNQARAQGQNPGGAIAGTATTVIGAALGGLAGGEGESLDPATRLAANKSFFDSVADQNVIPIKSADDINVALHPAPINDNFFGSLNKPTPQNGEMINPANDQLEDTYLQQRAAQTNQPAVAGVEASEKGPDLLHSFQNLKDPQGMADYLASKGVNTTSIQGNAVYVADPGGELRSTINQVSKDTGNEFGSQHAIVNIQENPNVPNEPNPISSPLTTPETIQPTTGEPGVGSTDTEPAQGNGVPTTEVPTESELQAGANPGNQPTVLNNETSVGADGSILRNNQVVANAQDAEMGKVLGLSPEQVADAATGQPAEDLYNREDLQNYPAPGSLKESAPEPEIGQNITNEAATAEHPLTPTGIFNLAKNLPDTTKQPMIAWMRERLAAPIDGAIAKAPFEELDSEGVEGFAQTVKDIQSGTTDPKIQELRNYFDNKYQELTDKGVRMAWQANYLPQLWKNDTGEIAAAMGRRLNIDPSFTFEKVIDDYQTGIDAGLTPRFTKVSDLVGWYESKANQSLADQKLFDSLGNQGNLRPVEDAPIGWEPIKNSMYAAPAPIARVLNSQLGTNDGLLAAAAKGVQGVQRAIFTTGVPYTGLNFEGLNKLVNSVGADGVAGLARGVKWIANPSSAQDYLDANLNKASFFVNHGLTLDSETKAFSPNGEAVIGDAEPGFFGAVKNLGNRGSQLLRQMFSNPILQKAGPAMKLAVANSKFDDLIGKGMDQDVAAEAASKFANESMRGLNYNEMFRNPDFQNSLRIVAFAPDLIESGIRNVGDVAKSLTTQIGNPEYAGFRGEAGNLAAAYVALNVVNKLTSGHFAFQNAKGNIFKLQIGSHYEPVFGSYGSLGDAAVNSAAGLSHGNISSADESVRNHLSGPLQVAMDALSNTNSLGQTLTSKNNSLGQNVGNVVNTIANTVAPPPIQALVNRVTGQTNNAGAVAQALGFPGAAGTSGTGVTSTPAPSNYTPSGFGLTNSSLVGTSSVSGSSGAFGGGNGNVGTTANRSASRNSSSTKFNSARRSVSRAASRASKSHASGRKLKGGSARVSTPKIGGKIGRKIRT